jgi:hypothetical protein
MSLNQELFEVVLDEGAIIVDFNSMASIISGYSRSEVIGKNWFELFIEDENIVEVLTVFSNLFHQDTLSWEHTNSIVCKNGEIKTLTWKNNIIIDKKQRLKLIHSLGREIVK